MSDSVENVAPAAPAAPVASDSVFDQLMGERPHAPENVGKKPETTQQLREVLEYDPFKPPPKPIEAPEGTPEAAAKAAKAPKEQPPKAAPAAAPVAVEPSGQPPKEPATPPAVDPRDSTIRDLQTQMQMMKSTIEALNAAQRQPAQVGQPPAEAPEPAPAYVSRIAIPPQLMQMIESEDAAVRQQGLTHLVQGTAQIIHTEALKAVRAEMQNVAAEVANRTVQGVKTGDNIMQDYYGTYPQHSNLKSLVAQASQEVMAETGLRDWSEHLKVAVGNRVNQYIARAGFAPAPVPAPVAAPGPVAPAVPAAVPTPATVSRPPAVFAGNVSPGIVGGQQGVDPNSPEGIQRALFGSR